MLCIGPPPGLPANCRLPVAARSRPQCRAGVHARRSSLASPHPAANRQSLPCKGRCRRRRRRGAAPRPANTLPARRTRSPATYLRRGRCFASPCRQTSRQTAAYPSPPVPGHNVGRAFTPAAAPLRHHTAPHSAKSPLRRSIRQPAAAPLPCRRPPKPPLQGEVPPQAAEGCRTSPRQYPSGSQHSPVIAHPVQTPDALPPASPFPAAKQKPRPGFSPDRDLRVSFSIVSAAAPAWFAAVYRVTPRRPALAG